MRPGFARVLVIERVIAVDGRTWSGRCSRTRGRKARRCWSWTAPANSAGKKTANCSSGAVSRPGPRPADGSIRRRTQGNVRGAFAGVGWLASSRGGTRMSLAALGSWWWRTTGSSAGWRCACWPNSGSRRCRKPPTAAAALALLEDGAAAARRGARRPRHARHGRHRIHRPRRAAAARARRRAGQRAGPGAAEHRADDGARLRAARARQHREAAEREKLEAVLMRYEDRLQSNAVDESIFIDLGRPAPRP